MEYIDKLRPILISVREKILEIYNSDFSVYLKEDKSPVTEADEITEVMISEALREISKFPVVGEESFSRNKKVLQCDDYWLLDPIDGTKNFVNKTGDFCISIGLIKNRKPYFGLIYKPTSGEIYYAQTGKGAYYEFNEKVYKLCVNKDFINGVTVVFNNKATGKDEYVNYLSRKITPVHIRKVGSTALKLCDVATGRSDIFPKQQMININEWDIAAGHIILKEAGGNIFDNDGNEIAYFGVKDIVKNFTATSNILYDVIK